MLDDLIAAYGNRFLVAALGVSLALLCLFIVLWILRNRAPSPFVRGGRNRHAFRCSTQLPWIRAAASC
jgi:hypothetical protein